MSWCHPSIAKVRREDTRKTPVFLAHYRAVVYYRLLDARTGRRSTVLATNIDFKAWADYLGDPPLATAFLDRLVDGAVILKLTGRSYRAHRARPILEADGAD
jgi:DNA replication protein DnaC